MSKKLCKILFSLTCVAALSISSVSALHYDFFTDAKPETKTGSFSFAGVSDEKLQEAIKKINEKWEGISKDNETLNTIAQVRCELVTRIVQNKDFVDQYKKYTKAAEALTAFEITEAIKFNVDKHGHYTETEDEQLTIDALSKTITIEKHVDQIQAVFKELSDFQKTLNDLGTKEEKEKFVNASEEILKINDKPIFNSGKTKGKAFVEKVKLLEKMLSDMQRADYQENIKILSLFSDEYTILDNKAVEGKDQVGSVEYFQNEIKNYEVELKKMDDFIGIYELDTSIFEKHCPIKFPLNVTNLEKKKDKYVEKEKTKTTPKVEKDVVPNTGARR